MNQPSSIVNFQKKRPRILCLTLRSILADHGSFCRRLKSGVALKALLSNPGPIPQAYDPHPKTSLSWAFAFPSVKVSP